VRDVGLSVRPDEGRAAGRRARRVRAFPLVALANALIAVAVQGPAGAVPPPITPPTEPRLRLYLHAADLSACDRTAKSARKFGSVIVTAWHLEGGRLVLKLEATKSLGPAFAECALQRLTSTLDATAASKSTAVPKGPGVVTVDISIGEPAPLLPALETLTPIWSRLLRDRDPVARRELERLLPPDARLSADGCVWLPGTTAMAQASQAWLKKSGPLASGFWRTAWHGVLETGTRELGPVAVVDASTVVYATSFVPLSEVGTSDDVWRSTSAGGLTCLRFLSEQEVASLRRRIDARSKCWVGDTREVLTRPRQSFPKDHRYQRISARDGAACALDEHQNLRCCATDADSLPYYAPGPFAAISTAKDSACALRPDGRSVCWGPRQSGPPPHAERFSSISAGSGYSCGITRQQILTCWGSLAPAQARLQPRGKGYVLVSVDSVGSVALKADGQALFWTSARQLIVPGRFRQVTAYGGAVTGLDVRDRLLFWRPGMVAPDVLKESGCTDAVYATPDSGCALTPAGVLTCSSLEGSALRSPTPGRYLAMSGGPQAGCAVTDDGRIRCWGHTFLSEQSQP